MDNVRKVSQESGGLVKNVLESQNWLFLFLVCVLGRI
jgi:hypothetical protein